MNVITSYLAEKYLLSGNLPGSVFDVAFMQSQKVFVYPLSLFFIPHITSKPPDIESGFQQKNFKLF